LQWQFLETGGWDAAAATQAFSYMDYSEVRRYSQIYTAQKTFNDFEEKAHGEIIVLSPMLDPKSATMDEKRLRDNDIQLLLGYSCSIDQIGHELLTQFDKVQGTKQ
jgi:predicted AlkP superfamily pyrophosphatase or phosphodiesterase